MNLSPFIWNSTGKDYFLPETKPGTSFGALFRFNDTQKNYRQKIHNPEDNDDLRAVNKALRPQATPAGWVDVAEAILPILDRHLTTIAECTG